MFPLAFILPVLILFIYHPTPEPSEWAPELTLTWVLFLTLGQLVLIHAAIQLVKRMRRNTTSAAQVARLRLLATLAWIANSALYFVDIHLLDLPKVVHNSTPVGGLYVVTDAVLLVPYFAVYLGEKVLSYRHLARVADIALTRSQYLTVHLRALAVFVSPQLLYISLARVIFSLLEEETLMTEHPAFGLTIVVALGFVLFSTAPLLVRHLFRSHPLGSLPPEQALADRIRSLANQANIALGRIYVWHTMGLRYANAAVTGLVSRVRHFFVSDYLLSSLDQIQLQAVFAHELGHVHFRHLLYNFALAMSILVFMVWSLLLVLPHIETSTGAAATVIILEMAYILVVFRLVLNRFEKQADLYAYALLGQREPITSSLDRLVQLNLSRRRRRSITHPSIESRIRFLQSVASASEAQMLTVRARRRNRYIALAIAVAMASTLVALEML